MPRQIFFDGPGFDSPEFEGGVTAAAGQKLAAGEKGNGIDFLGVAFQGLHQVASG